MLKYVNVLDNVTVSSSRSILRIRLHGNFTQYICLKKKAAILVPTFNATLTFLRQNVIPESQPRRTK